MTVHGRDEVAEEKEFHRSEGDRTGQALVAALQASPCRDIEIEPKRERLPVRGVKLGFSIPGARHWRRAQ